MNYIFLISFDTTKIFKFKTYHIITIDITPIIDRHIQIYSHVDYVLI